MRKFLLVAILLICAASTAFAEERLIEASGEYVVDPRLDETNAAGLARAREEAKRAAVEKAGVYLESRSKTIDSMLVEDEIRTVAARLLKVQSETPRLEIVDNRLIKFTVTITALVDDLSDDELKALLRDKESLGDATRKYRELKEKYDALNAEMATLKRGYDSASDSRKIEIKREVARNVENFSAVEAMGRGNEFYFAASYGQALAAYDEAIRLNPRLAEAYNNRGIVKYALGQYAAAIEDYSAAISLKPAFADALNNRGNALAALGQFPAATQDLQAALRINPDNAVIRNNLGGVYYSMKNFDAALGEYARAIQLAPNYAEAYYNRGAAYYVQGHYAEALSDVKASLELKPADGSARDLYEKIRRKLG